MVGGGWWVVVVGGGGLFLYFNLAGNIYYIEALQI